MSSPRRVVVVGHGVAGLTAAGAARAQDPEAEIVLLGDEPYDAYYRPRLSHDLATGIDAAKIRLRPEGWYKKQQIDVRRGRAQAIDPRARTVSWSPVGPDEGGDGDVLSYDSCVLATGSRCNRPPLEGGSRPGVFTLRSAGDAAAIRKRATEVEKAAVAGGGLLGLETAHGLVKVVGPGRVCVLERGPWLLRRQLDQEGGELLARALTRVGIEILTEAEVASVAGRTDGEGPDRDDLPLAQINLKDGRRIGCGLLVFAAGVRPRVDLAQAAGLAVERRGVVVDDRMQTSDPAIYACGDVALHHSGNYAIWPQAMAQGRIAGGNAAGGAQEYSPVVPQTLLEVAGTSVFAVGEAGAADEARPGELIEVGRGDRAECRYAKFRLRDGRLAGAMLIGQADLAKLAKAAVEKGLDLTAVAAAPAAERFDLIIGELERQGNQ